MLDWARRIVADARAMRDEVKALRKGLSGHVTLSVIPTALAATTDLTGPFRRNHPDVTIGIRSRASHQILTDIEEMHADAGITYLDNEPIGRLRAQPLYEERYALLTMPGGPFATASEFSWSEAGALSLALLTPDMQNRRIIDQVFASLGRKPEPQLQSDSMVALIAAVAAGQGCAIMPTRIARLLGAGVVIVPLVEPEITQTVGLVTREIEPPLPLVAGLMLEARRLWAAAMPMGPGATRSFEW